VAQDLLHDMYVNALLDRQGSRALESELALALALTEDDAAPDVGGAERGCRNG
jgi:hypothetical protein